MAESRFRATAVVMAHSRRQFIGAAVASVRAQRLAGAAGELELLVTKDFPDPEIDRLSGVRTLDSTGSTLGEMLAGAVEEARGEILCFLDDDDLWEPEKMARVFAEFDRRPGLGYFGHGQSVIDTAGRPMRTGGAMWRRQRRVSAPIYIERPEPGSASLLWANAGNESSIALLRSSLADRLAFVRRIQASMDDFLLWNGLLSGHGLVFTAEPLTRLRVHTENYSRGGRASFSEYVRRYRRMRTEEIHSHDVAMEMAAGTPWIQTMIAAKRRDMEHYLHVMNADQRRGRMAQALFGHPEESAGVKISRALYAVSPGLAQVANFLNGMARW